MRTQRIHWAAVYPVILGALGALGLIITVSGGYALVSGGPDTVVLLALGLVLGLGGGLGLRHERRAERALELGRSSSRETFLAVTSSWALVALVGTLPYLLTGTIDRPLAALYESMSGFTTTGGSAIADVDAVDRSVMLYRMLTHWMGGIGIIVLFVAAAPRAGAAAQRVFLAEHSSLDGDRAAVRIADVAKISCGIYGALTGLCALAYALVGLPAYDAICHAMSTVATGGFSTRTDSIGHWDSPALEVVAIAFMFASGINYLVYWGVVRGRRARIALAELRTYAVIVASASVAVVASLVLEDGYGVGAALRHGVFTVVNLSSTTGFYTDDYDGWSPFALLVIIAVFSCGACSGSTSGGIHPLRVLIAWRSLRAEVHRALDSRSVQIVRVGGQRIAEEAKRAVALFVLAFVLVAFVGSLALAADGHTMREAVSATLSSMTNAGMGLGDLGPSETYAAESGWTLSVLTVLMLAGRMELFALLVLLLPRFWRR